MTSGITWESHGKLSGVRTDGSTNLFINTYITFQGRDPNPKIYTYVLGFTWMSDQGTGEFQLVDGFDGNGPAISILNKKFFSWDSGSYDSGFTLSVGVNYQVVLTSTGTRRQFYVNGVKTATDAATNIGNLNAGPFKNVLMNHSGSRLTNGLTSYFYTYGRALRNSEVKWLYEEPFAGIAQTKGPLKFVGLLIVKLASDPVALSV